MCMKKVALIILLITAIYSVQAGGELVPFNAGTITRWVPIPFVITFSSDQTPLLPITATTPTFSLKASDLLKCILIIGVPSYLYSKRTVIWGMFTRTSHQNTEATPPLNHPQPSVKKPTPPKDEALSDTPSDIARTPSPALSDTDSETDGYFTCQEDND